jgi:ketosteroid isomerase-like protein
MSQENVDTIREVFDRFNRADDDRLIDDLFDPAAVWHSRTDEPDTGIYRGAEAIKEMSRMWRGMFEDWRAEPEEFIDAGEFVVVPGWLCGRGRESGAEVREPYAWVYRLRGGKVAEVWEHRDRREALEAVRLSEQGSHADSS